jgi:hypothetical protein
MDASEDIVNAKEVRCEKQFQAHLKELNLNFNNLGEAEVENTIRAKWPRLELLELTFDN